MPGPVRFDSLGAWLDWQLTLHPQPIEPGLERVARVARRSGWSPPSCPVITIGGTNGKGSCVALADAILREGGYRTATFTSPHLVDYAERIRLQGHPVSAASLVAAFERIADALGPDTLTFFEFNTLAALLIFDSAGPDAVILEVGMGGRLDAVNIVDADVAVVVSLGIDHAEWLGADIETIAREKAGIFRAGRPAVFGGDEAPPGSLIEAAHAEGALLRLRGRDFREIPRPGGRWDLILGTGITAERLADLPVPALAGTAQLGNSATTIAALRELRPRLPSPVMRSCAGSSASRCLVDSRGSPIANWSGCSTSRTIRPRRVCWPQACAPREVAAGPPLSAGCWPTKTSGGWWRSCADASTHGSRRRPRVREVSTTPSSPGAHVLSKSICIPVVRLRRRCASHAVVPVQETASSSSAPFTPSVPRSKSSHVQASPPGTQ
jgi:dihydrofolate synthase/folylpolyglutamate synthase